MLEVSEEQFDEIVEFIKKARNFVEVQVNSGLAGGETYVVKRHDHDWCAAQCFMNNDKMTYWVEQDVLARYRLRSDYDV